jgi:hypothetical protein
MAFAAAAARPSSSSTSTLGRTSEEIDAAFFCHDHLSCSQLSRRDLSTLLQLQAAAPSSLNQAFAAHNVARGLQP